MLNEKEIHEMKLEVEHEGTEVWMCLKCDRRILIEWNPFRRVTLKHGDNVIHTGFKGTEQVIYEDK